MAAGALAAFWVFAVLDWIAVARGARGLEYVAKPAALAALLVWAATGAPPRALLVALFFSLCGDVLLMVPADLFLFGLLAFLVGHIAYIAAFRPPPVRGALWVLVILALLSPIAARILRAVREPPLRAAVALYSLVIATMVASAVTSGSAVAVGGALLFLVSDMLIAWNRFVAPAAWAPVAIIVTYHLGQAGLAAALRG